MVRGFNDFNKEDQERLFWLLGFLMLFLIFLLIIIPLSITDSQTLIKDGLTSDAFVIDMYERDGTFEYYVKYAVSNGDTLIATPTMASIHSRARASTLAQATHASRAVVGHLSYFDMNTNFS
jgi:hypothetical protein